MFDDITLAALGRKKLRDTEMGRFGAALVGQQFPVNRNPRRGSNKIQDALDEEERLRQEGISLLRGREEALSKDAEEMERDISASASRAAAGAYGRQTGRARGGGMLSALGQVEMDVERGARDLRRQAASERSQAAMDRLSFERSTMKTADQRRAEVGDLKGVAQGFLAASKTLGYVNKETLDKKVSDYIRDMGLSSEQARVLRTEANTLYDTDPWLG